MKVKRSETNPTLDFKALDSQNKVFAEKVNALQELNERFRVENEKVKLHYKELYDSIKITRAKTIEKTSYLLTEIENLKDQIKGKMKCVTTNTVKPKVLALRMYAINVEPIPPRNRNNREVHLDYLKHLKESIEALHEIVEEARVEKTLDSSLASACLYTKQSQELLEYVIGTLNCSTEASGSKPRSNTKNNGILPAKSVNKKNVEDYPRNNKTNVKQANHVDSSISYKREQCPLTRFTKSKVVSVKKHENVSTSKIVIPKRFSNTSQKPLTRYQRKNKQEKATSTGIPTTAETQTIDVTMKNTTVFANQQDPNSNWGSNIPNSSSSSVSNGRDSSIWNDHFGAIMGYGDYVIDLEVAFRKHSCYVRDTDGVELLKGSHGSNLYNISVEDMMKSSPICLLYKASKNKSCLWHRRLNNLNFDTINDLARKDLVRGLPRLKFEKDHLCSA
ncbi:integrase, catalytic region, zinc finger, CCHC-type containing protein [Tanacetum coccineum]